MNITLLYRVTRGFFTQIAGRVGGKIPLTVFSAKSIPQTGSTPLQGSGFLAECSIVASLPNYF
jgi:hypothetical protein